MRSINWIAALVCGISVGGGSAYGALPALERMSLHNRCMVAAIYAMTDDRYPEKDVKSVFFFPQTRADDVLRAAPYGNGTVFDMPSSSFNKKTIYRSLGWKREVGFQPWVYGKGWMNVFLKAATSRERKPCDEVFGHQAR